MTFKTGIKNVGKGLKSGIVALDNRPWLMSAVIGVVLNFIIEVLHRHSLAEGFLHVFRNPLPFLFNCLIITTVLSVCTLFKRRHFFMSLFSAVFLGFGIANSIVLAMRVTPLEYADIQVVKISIITRYLSTFHIALIVIGIVALIAGLVIFCIKCPKRKVDYLKSGIATAIYIVVLAGSLIGFRAADILLSQHTKNLANAYKTYGFNYCFLCSVFDLGIDKPDDYNKDSISDIVDQLNTAADNNQTVKDAANKVQDGSQAPNVIFLQLETFFDVNHILNVNYSENPIPNFTKLHNEFSSGYIGVPSIGAGTANTEFEVISGMSLDHFGVGEYPYKTILQTDSSESICYNLANHGYTSHAIHNNTAIFYDRNVVFRNLGFNTFTSIEYMPDVEFNENLWAKDNILTGCITDCLDSTEGSDMIYTITVQSHGKYLSDYKHPLPIQAENFSDDETINREFNYYINQLHEVDQFIGELIETLSNRDERTVVVMFGDHLPSFDLDPKDLEGGDIFQTEYVIWDNFGLETQNSNIMSYQMGAHVMELLGYDDGTMTKIHQNFAGSEQYSILMKTMQYDMLYGKQYLWSGKENKPYKATDLKMGVKDIIISDIIKNQNGTLTVKGDLFTDYSTIYINDESYSTVLIDKNTLVTEDKVLLKTGDLIAVIQIDSEMNGLSSTKYYLVGGTQEHPTITVDSTKIIYLPKGLKPMTIVAIIALALALIIASTSLTVTVISRKRAAKKFLALSKASECNCDTTKSDATPTEPIESQDNQTTTE